jgi:FixJ family two-component response regulator
MSGRREEVAEKIPEPFEYFEFIEKPFEQKELIEAIKAAMAKAKLPRVQAATPAASTAAAPATVGADSGAAAAEIQALNEKIAKMQAEIDGLKKQLAQIVTFIKQKLK